MVGETAMRTSIPHVADRLTGGGQAQEPPPLLKHQFDLSDIHLTLPITTLWRTTTTDPAMEAAVLPLVDGCSAKGTKEWTSQLQVSTTRLRAARAQDL